MAGGALDLRGGGPDLWLGVGLDAGLGPRRNSLEGLLRGRGLARDGDLAPL